MGFPKGFVWGAAAASYQIEGGAYEDGKGPSVWDTMSHWPGKVWEGNTGDVACDHYHRYEEDVHLMAEIGLNAYRFSINWPRVLPEGTGAANEAGLDFYDRLVDELLEAGIQPWATLFHWDYPLALYRRGGWLNRDSADWFGEYAAVIVDRLSDRVSHWMTQNEPQVYLEMGHHTGEHAPGLKLPFCDVLLGTHHSLLAHGKAVRAIRAGAKTKPVVGFVSAAGDVKIPATETREDTEAARQYQYAITEKNVFQEAWFSDPILRGVYPEDGVALFGADMPAIRDGDMELISEPIDFYALNIYQGRNVAATADGGYQIVPDGDGRPLTMMGWRLAPRALYWGPRFLHDRYKVPTAITENGMANTDWVHLDGKVHDPQRIDYLKRYLREYGRAIDDGVEALGYFVWSILDNFEWSWGYSKRFGIVYVDFVTGERILKDSAHWYRAVITSNGATLAEP
jgi:beta-glucosidase